MNKKNEELLRGNEKIGIVLSGGNLDLASWKW